jgi:flagellar hook protein FlgE
LDAAIQGDGFFLTKGANSATEYTRAGNFQVDKDGALITSTGEKVQGWTMANGVLNTNAPPSDLIIPTGAISAPAPSTQFSFNMNLNAAAKTGDTFSTAVQVYDSLGESHTVTVNFTKNATSGQWDYSISVPNTDVNSPFTPVTGSLIFDPTGKLLTPASDPGATIPITGLADGAADLSLNWSVYNDTTPRISQYSQPSAVSAVSQDGSAAAQLVRISIGDGGQIVAQYSNGQQQAVGQLAMALIRNPDSLIAVGDNSFQASGSTATAAVGLPSTGGRGAVSGGALESSTVDIAREFTNLIILQRGYQASAKMVTTVDQLSQDTINLIR